MSGLLCACSDSISNYSEIARKPKIDPDYCGITIPPNIAPLNFIINEEAEKYYVQIHALNCESINIHSNGKNIRISASKWKLFLEQCKGKDYFIEIFTKQEGKWDKYQTLINHVATDSIDSYLVYRLIDPGFKSWNKMGIYQRCLENFCETPIMVNDVSDGNCMNCHSFSKNSNNLMLFHMRGKNPGTIIYRNGKISRVNTKTTQTISAGVYPAWHPNGRYVAFSVNQIIQKFHSVPDRKIEVIDTLSDLILYDTETNVVASCAEISLKERFETFPSWSNDGKFLYFCSAKASSPSKYDKIQYDLLRIAFNSETSLFGEVDTVISSSKTGSSISFPRISPDGKFLLFCMSKYGNFSIWHAESDLYLKNLKNGEIIKPDINSDFTESYHTWSSSGRWIVFSSRRKDGLFTRPYFAYFDTTGKAFKPFLLPQKRPEFYKTFLKSFNVPELIINKVDLNPRDFLKIIKSDPIDATFKSNY